MLCPESPSTRHLVTVLDDSGHPTTLDQYGGRSADTCLCASGYYSANSSSGEVSCLKCPTGATCAGGHFPPIAQPGYGVFRGEPLAFVKCKNAKFCTSSPLDDKCDCSGGSMQLVLPLLPGMRVEPSAFEIEIARCGTGYAFDGEICSKCEAGYAHKQGQCMRCTRGHDAAYILPALLLALLWFPALRYMNTKFAVRAHPAQHKCTHSGLPCLRPTHS